MVQGKFFGKLCGFLHRQNIHAIHYQVEYMKSNNVYNIILNEIVHSDDNF